MVDLVKIRKKAKEQKADGGQRTAVGGQRSDESPETTAAPQTEAAAPPAAAAAPKPTKKDRKKAAEPVEPRTAAAPQSQPTADRRPPTADVVAPAAPLDPAAAKRATKLERFREEAGRRRQQADREGDATETAERTAAEGQIEVLTFMIGRENYAVDIEHIVEIVPIRTATRVPNADASVIGILSLRGTIVTLVDVHRRLTHGRSEPTADSRIVVVDHDEETIGFEVDRVFRVVKIDAAEVEPHPVVHNSELDDSIRGVFRQGESLTILLDFDKLLDRRETPRAGAGESLVSQI